MEPTTERLRKSKPTTGLISTNDVFNTDRSEVPTSSGIQVRTRSTLEPKKVNFFTKNHRTLAQSGRGESLRQPNSSLVLEPKILKGSRLNTENGTLVMKKDFTKYLPQKPLNIAVMNNKINTVLKLLDSGANPMEKDGYYGSTGIHWAAKANNVEVLELYRERGYDLSPTSNLNWTPIHTAAEGSQLKSLEWLLENGAGIESEDIFKQTPLYKAAFKGHLAAVKILLTHGASPHSKDSRSQTPLSAAAMGGYIETAKLLFEHGADLNHTDDWGRNLLHVAKTLPMLKWLIEHDLDIDRKDDWGKTPLHDAVEASDLQKASFLLEKGASMEPQDRNGCTPLYLAAKTGQAQLVKLFLENGANPESTAKDGSTPVEVATGETIRNLLLRNKAVAVQKAI
ncbi:serine/threonine-protein phosphatase 6 regulatory ankyrin repeat subunit A isoform X1 [Halyomorpha halys]|uniref:serine/threonine-protein phosphatase 6 regulatory ankyrin repeat subunit A isoform X1 n=1 Tax=Halyomorpha halys TaxID=286706 RepID=UPI0006D4F093|nr:ankyrin-1-like isoform X1 [Halyomorpha halys]